MDNLVGRTLGQYQLVEIIHQGENTVYKGFQPSLNRYVAVKVLNPALSQDLQFAQRFRQDMQQLVSLEHPHILTIYDYGQAEGVLYMVSRYIETGSLKDRLPPAFAPQQAQTILNQIADALSLLHSRGIIHGNLKPANILIDELGQPLLTDFGYTQGIDAGTAQENVYLSPEEAQSGQFDQRTDVYALGVSLYHLLIGQPPPVGSVPTPRAVKPDLSPDVEKVMLKAMAQYPDQRFQSAAEFSYALNAALLRQGAAVVAPVPVVVAAADTPEPQPEQHRGLGWLLAGAALVGFLLLVGCLLFALFFGPDDENGGAPVQPVPTFTPAPAPQPNQPPVPVIEGPAEAQANQRVSFSGRNSQPAAGSHIVAYEWDMGDGSTNSGADVSYSYREAGIYEVKLTVVDDKNLSSNATHRITIAAEPEQPTPAPEQPPVAVIDGPAETQVGQQVTFSAGNSTCSSRCVSFEWDLGDGTRANAERIDHEYNTANAYNVVLTVTDAEGLQGRTNHQIVVTEAPQPELPTPTEEAESGG
jgi:chitodextrinase